MMASLRTSFTINRNFLDALITGYGLMGITIVVQLVLIPLYLDHLGKTQFGVLTLILAATNYAAIGITWLSGGVARILAERAATQDREGFREAYAFAKIMFSVYALIAIGIFWLVAPFWLQDELANADIAWALVLACLYFFLAYEYNADRAALVARHWQAKGNLLEVAGQLLYAAIAVAGLYLGMGIAGVMAGQVAGVVCTRLLAHWTWKQDDYDLKWRWPIHEAAALWRRLSGKTGRDYVVYGVILLTLQADVLIVGWLDGPEGAASYYLLWRIPEVCILLLSRIPASYAPFLIELDAKSEHERMQVNYQRGYKLMFLLSALMALVYALGGHWMTNVWVGNNAPENPLAYIIAAGAAFFMAMSRWPASAAYALLNTGSLVKIAGTELLLKLALVFLLYPLFAYLSPLLAINAVHALCVFYLYSRLGRLSCSDHHLSTQEIRRC